MWGDPGVSKFLRLTQGATPFGAGGMPVNVPIQQTGILKRLVALTSATPTFTPGTGTINADMMGPFNLYTQIVLSPNQQAPVVQLSGYGAYLVDTAKSCERDGFTLDTIGATEANAGSQGDVFSARATTGTAAWKFPLPIHVAQKIRSLGGDIGMWPLQNPAMQLGLQFTPSSGSASSPYNVYSTTVGAQPYLVTGNSTVTLASPTMEVRRELWQVPASQGDMPPFDLVSSWLEEQPQGNNVNGASSFEWRATPLSGLLARLICFIYDGAGGSGNGGGVAASSLSLSNSLQITYDTDTPKFSESSYGALQRQNEFYGFNLPQGVYAWDFLGRDLTLQDVLNTNELGNIKLKASLSSPLGATGSAVKVIKQMISPLEVK